jgi:UPF0716 family protein affecting phage T7 exclusion
MVQSLTPDVALGGGADVDLPRRLRHLVDIEALREGIEMSEEITAHKAAAFLALPGWLQSLLAIIVGFLPQILAAAEPAVAAFIAAHLSKAQAQQFAKLGADVLALKP